MNDIIGQASDAELRVLLTADVTREIRDAAIAALAGDEDAIWLCSHYLYNHPEVLS